MKTSFKLIFIPILTVLMLTLVKCETAKEATLSTLSVTNITINSAQSGGNITSDGGGDITSRGVVWAKSPNPTSEQNNGFTMDGTGEGLFQSNIKNLKPNTTYYLRAFATNEAGIAYGQQEEFSTEDYSGGVTDIEGNFYPSVIIGNQEWMAENLKTTKYNNGKPIEYPGTDNNAWENNTMGAYAWYKNDIAWKDSYGALYNWHAVNNSNGLCPNGWHVPSDEEWTELAVYLESQGFSSYENGAGNALKSCRQVSSPLGGDCATSEHPRWDLNSYYYGTDEFSFSALPGACHGRPEPYNTLGRFGYWWSSSEYSSTHAWNRYLGWIINHVARDYFLKELGYSVRCVRDE